MNQKVFKTLEYYKILEQLADYAAAPETKKRIEELVPSTDMDEINYLQETTADALSRIYKSQRLSFSGLHNINGSLKRLSIGGSLNTVELLQIGSLLEVAKRAKAYDRSDRAEEKTDSLTEFFSQIEPLTPLHEEIKRCIIGEEEIADDASPTLSKIRKSIRGMNDRIHAQLSSLMNNATTREYLQDAVVTMRDGRYCLPVKAGNKSSIPGMVPDQSSSGSTVFIEPMAVVNLNNELKELFIKEKDEINVILAKLSEMVANYEMALANNWTVLSELDFIFAKAALAKSYNGVAPIFNERGYINIRKGRHPLLDPKKVVPIDVYLGDKFKQLIVTGPNTGGKTVSLKTVGLLTLMGQAGLHIPAGDRSELAIFEEVFADIGDEQSIEQSLSTFSSHMTSIVEISKHAKFGSLVLFDELGAGTDPVEGAALAMAILETFRLRMVKSVATTHYSELKMYALSTKGVENASLEFNVETLKPTYKLIIGIPGKSNAFAISSKIGLSDDIINKATEFLSSENIKFEDVLSDLEKNRNEANLQREMAERYKQELEELKKQVEEERINFKKKRKEILNEANEKAIKIIENAQTDMEKMVNSIHKLKMQENQKEAQKKLENIKKELKGRTKNIKVKMKSTDNQKRKMLSSKDIKIGDSVYILSLDQNATVETLPDKDNKLFVRAGLMKITVNLSDIELAEINQGEKIAENYRKKVQKEFTVKAVRNKLDLRGKYADEAILDVDRFLYDAHVAKLGKVEIVHGKGTGALKQAVHDYLKSSKIVKSYRLGVYGEGGDGVTIVEFN